MKVFDYVIIYNPTAEQIKEGEVVEIIADGRILAKDQTTAQMKAAMEIPEEFKDFVDQLEIAIRAF